MASYETIVKERKSVDTLGWDEILSPATISRVDIKNVGPEDVKIRTDKDDSGTEDTIPVGGNESLSPARFAAWRVRDPVCFLQASAGVSTVVLTWST